MIYGYEATQYEKTVDGVRHYVWKGPEGTWSVRLIADEVLQRESLDAFANPGDAFDWIQDCPNDKGTA